MPTFETPAPISVTIDLGAVRELLITASDRADTAVDVRPSDEAAASDVKAAEQIRVEYAGGALRITGPKVRAFDFSRKSRSVDVAVELPSGSQVAAEIQAGDIRGAGHLGECRFKTGAGNARLERTGPLRLDSGAGALTVGDVGGDLEMHTGTGKIQVGQVEGTAVVKSSNGDVVIAAVAGNARVRTANGAIAIDRAGAGVEAKTANGAIHLGEVVRGSVTLETAVGNLEIGVAAGTAAWLEVKTGFGQMHNLLAEAASPGESANTVEVRGRTSYGDITIRRS